MKFELRAVYDFPNSTDNRDLDCESYPIDDVPENDRYGKADKIGLYVRDEEGNLFHVKDFDTVESARQSMEAFQEFQELIKLLYPVRKKAVIRYSENPDSPLEWDSLVKLHFREHRRYSFPKQIEGFSFEDVDNEDVYETLPDGTEITVAQHQERELEKYHVFSIDCYEHGRFAFSLAGEGINCSFDTSKDCGIAAVLKELVPERSNALEMVRERLKEYENYVNGEVYVADIYDLVPTFDSEFDFVEYSKEYVETIGEYYSLEDLEKEIEKNETQEGIEIERKL